MRSQIAVTRRITGILKRLGLRDPLMSWRLERRRKRRAAAEASGSDALSRPALHGMDAKLNEILDLDGGYFVEAGANDGFTQSNTYWLERFRGWTGLLIEPMPELADEARRSRPQASVRQCALVPFDYEEPTVHMRFGDLMSTVDGVHEDDWETLGTVLGWRDSYEADVEARTLSSVLDEVNAPEVDLLSLDVEGFEAPVLRGLDLDRHAPRYVLVEIHNESRDRPKIDEVLAERYTAEGWLSPLDLLYVRRDLPRGGPFSRPQAG
jgi:FkbM family methyltransferase